MSGECGDTLLSATRAYSRHAQRSTPKFNEAGGGDVDQECGDTCASFLVRRERREAEPGTTYG